MIQRTKHYLEEAMFSQGLNDNFFYKAATDIDYLMGGIGGNYSHDHLISSVIGVGTRYDGKLEITLDQQSICHSQACHKFRSSICNKFFIGSHQVEVLRRNKTQIHLQTGSPVGHKSIVARDSYGTAGGFLLPKVEGKNVRLFSNNHVLANSNNAKIGDLIYETGNYPVVIGALEKFLPISSTQANELDLAVARIDGNVPLYASKYLVPRQPRLGERVEKTGAKTGKRYGFVASVDYTSKIDYRGFDAIFVNQTQIVGENGYKFSEGGDSGSLIFSTQDSAFVGLLFAGSGEMTIANPADRVNQQLKSWGY